MYIFIKLKYSQIYLQINKHNYLNCIVKIMLKKCVLLKTLGNFRCGHKTIYITNQLLYNVLCEMLIQHFCYKIIMQKYLISKFEISSMDQNRNCKNTNFKR